MKWVSQVLHRTVSQLQFNNSNIYLYKRLFIYSKTVIIIDIVWFLFLLSVLKDSRFHKDVPEGLFSSCCRFLHTMWVNHGVDTNVFFSWKTETIPLSTKLIQVLKIIISFLLYKWCLYFKDKMRTLHLQWLVFPSVTKYLLRGSSDCWGSLCGALTLQYTAPSANCCCDI